MPLQKAGGSCKGQAQAHGPFCLWKKPVKAANADADSQAIFMTRQSRRLSATDPINRPFFHEELDKAVALRQQIQRPFFARQHKGNACRNMTFANSKTLFRKATQRKCLQEHDVCKFKGLFSQGITRSPRAVRNSPTRCHTSRIPSQGFLLPL